MTPRERLLQIHGMVFAGQAPAYKCIVCLKELDGPDDAPILVCGDRCDRILEGILDLCCRTGQNISYKFDALADTVSRLREKRMLQ